MGKGFLCVVILGLSLPAVAKPTKEQIRISMYVELLNEHSKPMNSFFKYYKVEKEKLEACTGKDRITSRTLSGVRTYDVKKLKRYWKKGKRLKADKAGKQMIDSILTLDELTRKARDYYRGNYSKDKCRLGKKLDKRIRAEIEKFTKAEAAVRDFVEKSADDRAQKRIKKAKKKYGKRLRYYHALIGHENRKDLDFYLAQFSAKAPDISGMESRQKACMGRHQKAQDKTEDKHGMELKVLRGSGYKSFMRRSKDFCEEQAAVIKKIKDPKRPFKPRDAERLVKEYNYFVRESNDVKFSKKIK